jgi:RNA polymerase sigma-70 factor, ECF subfamily
MGIAGPASRAIGHAGGVGRGNNPRPRAVSTFVDAPAAFRQRLLQAIPRLRRYARTLAFDPAESDDLTQLTLERALSHWQQFDPARDMLVWLLSIAHNAHLDGRRRDARMQVTDPEDMQRAADAAGGDPGTDVGLRLDLLAALERLAPEQREALLLVCVEQLSYAEVAQVMRTPVGTVMSRVCRARAALRRHLEAPARGTGAAPTLRRVV